MIQINPDREAFERVCKELKTGTKLDCKHVADIFGWPAVELFLLLTMPQTKEMESWMENFKYIVRERFK